VAKNNFEKCLAITLREEGGFVNNPADPGGMTNLGVTKNQWEKYVGHEVTEEDMRALTPAIVSPFYQKMYWNVVDGDNLPIGFDLCVFDFAVNAGPGRSAMKLQEMLCVTQDGGIGPITISKLQEYETAHGQQTTIMNFQNIRTQYYESLPGFGTFGKGWLRRVNEITALALNMH
jgi:lysozyme family protein